MINKYITIQEASDLSGKSIQTIRRALKSKKLIFKRKNTPQGFNYLIERDSVCRFFKVKEEASLELGIHDALVRETAIGVEKTISEEKFLDGQINKDTVVVSGEDLRALTRILEKMVAQHSEERQSFMRLVNTMQEKVFILENQVNLLQVPKKSWFSFLK